MRKHWFPLILFFFQIPKMFLGSILLPVYFMDKSSLHHSLQKPEGKG